MVKGVDAAVFDATDDRRFAGSQASARVLVERFGDRPVRRQRLLAVPPGGHLVAAEPARCFLCSNTADDAPGHLGQHAGRCDVEATFHASVVVGGR